MPPHFGQPEPKVVNAFENLATKTPHGDNSLDPAEVWKEFRQLGLAGLSALNGLTPAQNQQLFNAVTLNEVIGWIVMGLGQKRVP